MPFIVEAAPRPMDLTAHAGRTLVAETLLALGRAAGGEEVLCLRVRQRGFSEDAQLQALGLLLAAGGADVRVLAGDAGVARRLGGEVPSPDALHEFLGACHDEAARAQRPPEGAWIPTETPGVQALHAVKRARRRGETCRAPGLRAILPSLHVLPPQLRSPIALPRRPSAA